MISVLLVAVATVLIHDALVAAGAVSGAAWLAWFVDKAKVISVTSWWLLWLGPPAALVGLLLVVVALKPRRSTHWVLGTQGVYIGRGDAGRLAANAASETAAVVDARVSLSGRNKLRVTATTIDPDVPAVQRRIEGAVVERLAALTPGPAVTTRVTMREE